MAYLCRHEKYVVAHRLAVMQNVSVCPTEGSCGKHGDKGPCEERFDLFYPAK